MNAAKSKAGIFARVRAVMAEESTVDVDEHARLIAEVAHAAQVRRRIAANRKGDTK